MNCAEVPILTFENGSLLFESVLFKDKAFESLFNECLHLLCL